MGLKKKKASVEAAIENAVASPTSKRRKNRAAKKAAETRAAKKAAAEVLPDKPATDLPDGVTIVVNLDGHTTIEDLTVTPPLRASAASEGSAREAYAQQRELRERQDAFDRGPVVATGVKSALPANDRDSNSDLNPGQDAPADNPI